MQSQNYHRTMLLKVPDLFLQIHVHEDIQRHYNGTVTGVQLLGPLAQVAKARVVPLGQLSVESSLAFVIPHAPDMVRRMDGSL